MPAFSTRALALLLTLMLMVSAACTDGASRSSTPTAVATLEGPTAEPGATPSPAPDALAWRSCGGGYQCATMHVPLDYASPQGRKIDIALIRLPARDGANRIGSLVVNFGGPGASGVDFLRGFAVAMPSSIRDRFDIVSFDPRGVGQSTPLDCHDSLQQYVAADPSPDNEDEWQTLESVTRDLVNLCQQRNGDLLPYLGSRNVARDLDQLRIALGDEKLTYLGYSYGTVIGQVYADLFPEKVRALVLDGAVDLSISGDQALLYQTLGFEGALQHYLDDCAAKRCITSFPDNPRTGINELLRRVEAGPISATGADRPLGPGEAILGLLYPLYSESLWSSLTSAVNAALTGNGTRLVNLADDYLMRESDGSYSNASEVLLAVNCIDSDYSRDLNHFRSLAVQFASLAPTFGAAIASGSACALWPVPPQPLTVPKAAGAPPILVIGTSGDPATPYAGAVALSQQLESGVLLTFYGEGHTAYLSSGSGCINDAVNKYLLTLEPPPKGTACGNPSTSPIIALPSVTTIPPPTPTQGARR